MSHPLAEVIMSVEVTVKISDTESNENKEVMLNEYAQIGNQQWTECFKAVAGSVLMEMQGMVKALEDEKVKKDV